MSSKYVDFLAEIKNKLSNISDRVYLEKAPQGAEFPYVTYYIQDSIIQEDNYREDFILNVDIWDKSNNTVTIEDMQYNIGKELNRFIFPASSGVMFHSYMTNKSMIPDVDESIKRREIRFIIKTYII